MHETEQYLNDWSGADLQTLKAQFAVPIEALNDVVILLASYTRDAFSGEAFVLFQRDGTLFEVNASHDSSDGVEGQWDPEETFVAALNYRLEKGRLGLSADGSNLFADELRFLLAELSFDGFR